MSEHLGVAAGTRDDNLRPHNRASRSAGADCDAFVEGAAVDLEVAEEEGKGDKAERSVSVAMGGSASLAVKTPSGVELEPLAESITLAMGAGTLTMPEYDGRLELTVHGEVELDADVTNLALEGNGILVIAEGHRVKSASVAGTTIDVRASARVDGVIGSFGVRTVAGHVFGDQKTPPELTHVSAQLSENGEAKGAVMEIDVTPLLFGELAQLEGFRVLDPTPERLRKNALAVVKKSRQEKGEATDIRDRARWFDELAARTEAHTLTGAAQSAIDWSRHYLHHKRVGTKSAEYWARQAHRAVGYGFRPTPAIASLLLVTFVVALMSFTPGCESVVGTPDLAAQYCVEEVSAERWHDFPRAWSSVLIAPAKLVRLTDSASPLPYFKSPLDSAINVVITLTFLFTVLSLRNYLRIRTSE